MNTTNKTLRECIVDFFIEKNRIIYAKTGVIMFNREDMAELNDPAIFTDDLILAIADQLVSVSDDTSEESDCNICAWCVYSECVLNGNCPPCSYGARHGFCNKGENIYDKVIDAVHEYAIIDIPGIKEEVIKTANKIRGINDGEE